MVSQGRVKYYMKENTEIEKILVISGTHVERVEGDFFAKSSFVNYLHELDNHFENVYFLARDIGRQKNYSKKIDKNRVKVFASRVQSGNRFLHLLAKLKNTFLDQVKLFNLLDENTGVIIYHPCSWAVPSIPLIWLKAGRYVPYYGNDPEEFVKMVEAEGGLGCWVKSYIYRFFYNFSLLLSDRVIARGGNTYRKISERKGEVFKTKPVISFDNNDIHLRRDTCQKDKIRIIYVGGLYKRKGIDDLLKAFKEVLQDFSHRDHSLKLSIIGSGPQEDALKRKTQDLDLTGSVEFKGYIDDDELLLKFYRNADIFVLPSKIAEGYPRVLDEAMANSLPVLATEVGSIPDELNHEQEAYLVPPGNQEQLSLGLKELITNSGLRKRIIKNGRRRFRDILEGGGAAQQHAEIVKGREIQ